MSGADKLRENAKNCANLAEAAEGAPEKARYKRMEKAWDNLADNQEWLDGDQKAPPPERRQ